MHVIEVYQAADQGSVKYWQRGVYYHTHQREKRYWFFKKGIEGTWYYVTNILTDNLTQVNHYKGVLSNAYKIFILLKKGSLIGRGARMTIGNKLA